MKRGSSGALAVDNREVIFLRSFILSKHFRVATLVNRRSFLKSSGLAAGVAVMGNRNADAVTTESSIQASSASVTADSPVSLVNLFQGNDSTPVFSRGNTLPIAARPFGMAHWTLQSHANTPWMFQPGERRIQGFRSTHQLSPWLGDYGYATFLPFCGSIQPEPTSRASSYKPEEAKLSPHSLRLNLLRYGINVELIPTERCALLTASFSKPDEPGWLIDIPGDQPPTWQHDDGRHTVSFTSKENQGGVPEDFATYYVLQFSEPWKSVDLKSMKGHSVGLVKFAMGMRTIDVRVGTSFISFEQAQRNLDLEVGDSSADVVRREGETVWNKHLGHIVVTGGTLERQKTFYSCLYRTLLFPRIWHEPDATGAMQHRSPYNGKILPGVMYADHGYWDVYRAWYPLMTVLFPERLAEILQSWVNAYKEGGWLPQFPCPGYRACMTGSLIDSLFGDAAAKKLGGFDLETAYAGLRKHAMEQGNPDAGYGRRGLKEYLQYGYAPAGLVEQSAAETVDAAYGDFCIAQVAKALGHDADYEMFMRRSENWQNLFDPQTGFLRGKMADGRWSEPFDPVTWGDPYVEGSAWQHRWDVPHNIAGLISALGGEQKAVAALEEMLSRAPDFNVGVYGQEIHEMSEMAAVRFGQYAHSNQPVHHVLYIFAAAGRPDRTRYWTRRVMEELYTPETFAGDEDTGSMAAWFILSALGFFPLCPGKPEYTLGQSFFPMVTVKLPQGKTLRIENAATGGNTSSVVFNGQHVVGSTLSHATLMAGGHLCFR
jgi:predicted alpha-1,2-mannosidase